MTTVITLHPMPETEDLAAASGAPRPLTIQRIPVPADSPAGVPPLKMVPRRAPEPAPAPLPGGGDTARHWRSDPADDVRVDAIVRSVAQAGLEVLGGTRPLQQMARWLDPASFERLALRANLVRGRDAADSAASRGRNRSGAGTPSPDVRLHRQVRIRSARVCPVSEGVYEAAVVAQEQSRVRAVALRVELRRGLWKITALEIG